MRDEKNIYGLIGSNIRYYRTHTKSQFKEGYMTQRELADICFLSKSLISNIESKRNKKGISIYSLEIIAKNLGVELKDLLVERQDLEDNTKK